MTFYPLFQMQFLQLHDICQLKINNALILPNKVIVGYSKQAYGTRKNIITED